MRNVNKILVAIIHFCVLCFFSCSKDNNPVDSNCNFDSNLIGEWYFVDTMVLGYPSPGYYFDGIQITTNHTMFSLGIEINTGTLAIDEYPIIDSIISAKDGKIIIKYYNDFFTGLDTLNYNINGNKLVLENPFYSKTYVKTSLNSIITSPITSNLSVSIDSVLTNNLKVYNYPSAYLSKGSASDISLFVNLKSSHISIEINNFNGIGVYNIPYHKAEYWVYDSDVVIPYFSDSVATATLSIEQYDEINNSCTGRFSFDVYDGYDIQNSKIKFREGTFTVPIYK